MYLSHTITAFMDKRDVDYETVGHRHTMTAGQTANTAEVPRDRLAKGVLFCDEDDYVLAIVPATTRVDPRALGALLGERELELASEDEVGIVFPDCELGAIPAVGLAYGIDTVVDESLLEQDDVYFEGGDHEHVVHVSGDGFHRLMAGVPHGNICGMN
jgi:Ala-tRNA(Pro) deacylase